MKVTYSTYLNCRNEAERIEWMRDLFGRCSRGLDRLRGATQELDPTLTFDGYCVDPMNEHQTKAFRVCKLFAQNLAHRIAEDQNGNIGILMLGSPGCGKTHLASAILNAVAKTCPGYYITARDLMDFMRKPKEDGNSTINRMELLRHVSVLVVDEIGRSFGTDFERKTLRDIFDARQADGLPTILITNCDRPELATVLDETFVSRLKMLTYELEFNWDDYRGKVAVNKRAVEEVFGA